MFKTGALRLAILLLPLLCPIAESHNSCRRQYDLRPNQPINVTSENFPKSLPGGSRCSYLLRAPVNHKIEINCNFEVIPDICQAKYLFISIDGDMQFREPERICRLSPHLMRTSNFQSLALAYESNSATSQQRARLICQAVARAVPCACGWSQPTRISNGFNAAKNEFPSMVAIRDIENYNWPVYCGGSIVTNRYILTAAHCLTKRSAASFVAHVGVNDVYNPNESMFDRQYYLETFIVHQQYDSSRTLNDIGLVRTVEPIEFSRGVGPICLPMRMTEASAMVDMVGYGLVGLTAARAKRLQKAQLLISSNADCQTKNPLATVIPSQLCTYDYSGKGQDSCGYDSGGPIIERRGPRMVLVGIISWGQACGDPYGIGINTRVSAYRDWLRHYLGDSVCVI